MYSGESAPDAPERMDTFLDSSQTSWEEIIFDASLKEEPLDIMDCTGNDPVVKSESEDDASDHIKLEVQEDITELNISESVTTDNSSMPEKIIATSNISGVPNKNANSISTGEVPVTRKVIINGQAKTCILVNNPLLKQSLMNSVEKSRESANNPPSLNKSSFIQNASNQMVNCCRCTSEVHINNFREHIDACQMVKCSRCGSEVHIDEFRQHIDTCPPRNRKRGSARPFHDKTPKGSVAPKAGQNQTVQAMYNPSTGQVVTLNDSATKSIFQISKNVGNIPESNFASKETNTSSQNSLAIKDSCLTNIRFQSNNQLKAASYIPPTLNDNSQLQCLRTSLQPIPADYSTSVIVENAESLQAPCSNGGCNKSNIICPKKTRLYCNKCEFSSTTLLILDIHMKKHIESENRPYEQISEETLEGNSNNVLNNLSDTAVSGCNNAKLTSEPKEYDQEGSRISRIHKITGSPRSVTTTSTPVNAQEDQRIGNLKANGSSKNAHNGEPRNRSESAEEENYNSTLLCHDPLNTENMSSCLNVDDYGKDLSKTSVDSSSGIWNTLGNSKDVNVPEIDEYSPASNLLLLQNNTFSCSVCSYTTDKKKTLANHERNHRTSNLAIFRCFYCSQRYTRYSLYLHIQDVHPGQKFQIRDEPNKAKSGAGHKCSLCSFSTNYRAELLLHKTNHSLEGNKSTDKCSDSVEVNLPTSLTCSMCSFSTSDQKQLTVHLSNHRFEAVRRTDSSGLVMFCCEYCSYKISKACKVSYHLNSHKNNRPIKKCSKCPFKSTPQALFCHMQKCKSKSGTQLKKPKRSYKCAKCAFSTTEQVKLKLHEKKHRVKFEPIKQIIVSGRPFYNCGLCSHKTVHGNDMRKHIKTHETNPQIIKCLNCSFKSTAPVLKFHSRKCKEIPKSAIVSKSHGVSESNETKNDPPSANVQNKPLMLFKCTKCSFFTTLRIKLKLHIRKRHLKSRSVIRNASSPTAKNNVIKCKHCSFVTTMKSILTRHLKSHNKHIPMKQCSSCSFKSTLSGLRNHCRKSGHNSNHVTIKATKKVKEYQCLSCSFITKNQHAYCNHMKIHKATNKAFRCRFCSLVCSTPSSLKSHIKSHRHKQAMESCPECNFKSTPGPLRNHVCGDQSVKTTDGDHINTKDSNNKKELATSIMNKKIGSDRTPNLDAKKSLFQCSLCPFSTSLRIKLNFHSRKHHQSSLKEHFTKIGELYQCSYCSYIHIRKDYLTRHIGTHLKWHMPIEKCKKCDYTSTLSALRRHLLNCRGTLNTTNTITSLKSNKGKTKTEVISKISSIPTAEIINANKNKRKRMSNRNKVDRFVKSDLRSVNSDLDSVKSDLGSVKSDLGSVKSDLGSVKSHLDSGKSDVGSVKPDVGSVKPDVDSVKLNLGSVKSNLGSNLEKDTSTCKLCSYTTKHRSTMNEHILAHKTKPIEECNKCSYRATPRALSIHMTKCRSTMKKQMTKNNSRDAEGQSNKISLKNCNEKENSRKKTANVTSPKVFNCPSCSFTSFWLYVMDRHIKSHTVLKLPIKQCVKCDFRSTPVALNAHTKACSGISGSSPELSKSDNSSIDTHRATANNTGITNYTLNVSETESNDKDKNNSSNPHSPLKQLFSCPNCSFTTNLRIKLKIHLQKSHLNSETVEANNRAELLLHTANHSLETDKRTDKCSDAVEVNLPTSLTCSMCSFSTSDQNQLSVHLTNHPFKAVRRTDASGLAMFYCVYCSYQNSQACKVSDHLNSHKNNRPIEKCTKCQFKSTPHALLCHMQKCPTKSNSGTKLKMPKTSYKCFKCLFSTTNQMKLKLHKKKHVAEPIKQYIESDLPLYNCEMCSYETPNGSDMRKHIITHKANPLLMTCLNCSFKSTAAVLKFHVRKCNEIPKSAIVSESQGVSEFNEMKNYPPSLQNNHSESETVEARAELLLYTANHSLETDKSTDKCSDSVKVNLPTSLTCSMCSFSTSDQKQLTVHLTNHPFEVVRRTDASGLVIFCCEYCSYQNSKAGKVSDHLNSHKNNRPIEKCTKCQFKSTPHALFCHMQRCPSKSNLTNEQVKLKLQRKEQPIQQCEMCSYESSHASDMRKHIITHKTNPLLMKCPNCSFKSTANVLKFHVQKCNEIPKLAIVSESQGVSESNEMRNDPPSLQNNQSESETVQANNRAELLLYTTNHSLETDKRTDKCSDSVEVNLPTSLTCSMCSFSTYDQKQLTVHLTNHRFEAVRRTDASGLVMFCCQYCSYQNSKACSVSDHLNSHKNNRPIEKCSKCQFNSTPHALLYHMQKCPSKSNSTSEQVKLKLQRKEQPIQQCEMCSYETLNGSDMRKHIITHKTNPLLMKCLNCSFKSTSAVLKFHVRKCNAVPKSAIVSESQGMSESTEMKMTH